MSQILKIDGKPVGLMGLQGAAAAVIKEMDREQLTMNQAAELLLERIAGRNYIPASKEGAYLSALKDYLIKRIKEKDGEEESDDLGHEASADKDAPVIRILGPGCVGCNRLEELVISVMSELGVAADIYHVRELDEIWRFGVTKTPALVIGGKVLSAGRIPTRFQVEQWIRQFIL